MTAGASREKPLLTGVKHDDKHHDCPKVEDTASKRLPSSSWKVFFTIALGILACLMATKHISSPTLPKTYALCSKQPNGVYTVDQHNSQTQCIVIQGGYIVDTGSLGESCYLLSSFFFAISLLDFIKLHWHKSNTAPQPLLPIRYIAPGAIIVPGLSGTWSALRFRL